MKLSSILSMFMLLAVCSTALCEMNFGEFSISSWKEEVFENFFQKQPNFKSDSQRFRSDLERLWNTGICENCDLEFSDLRDVAKKYKGINLSNSNCRAANLSGVDLYKAKLFHTDLSRAYLEGSDLEDVSATGANFSHANMKKTIMPQAKFFGAIFHKTDLEEANLNGTKFEGAYMDYANMKRTNIENADFHRAYLKETNFKGAKVNEKTSFYGADCISTNFRNILNLDKANFSEAILYGCKVANSSIVDKIRTHAKSIVGTLLKNCSKKDIECTEPYIEIK